MNDPLPTDLAGAFAKPNRAAGIAPPPARAKSKKTSEPRQRPVEAVPEPEAAPEAGTAATAAPAEAQSRSEPRATARPRSRNATARSPKAAATSHGTLVLWTPVTIRDRMKMVRGRSGTTYLDQVLDALESQAENLTEIVAAYEAATKRSVPTTVVRGKLFERATTAPTPGDDPSRRVQLTIRGVLQSQRETIDQLVESSGARSRSALINAVLDAALPA